LIYRKRIVEKENISKRAVRTIKKEKKGLRDEEIIFLLFTEKKPDALAHTFLGLG
jgi:hypothetical protein